MAEFHRKQPIHLLHFPSPPSSCGLSGSTVGVVQEDGGGLWERGGRNLRVTELYINRNGVFRGRVILRRHSRVSLFRVSL